MLYDLFICHASEDKASFVRPLAEMLRSKHIEVWYDEFSLTLGDSVRRAIDKGLKQSSYGVVVLSKAFFDKKWPQYELDGLAEREVGVQDKVILPIWHGVTHEDIMKYSPSLAGRKAASSSEGIEKVADEIFSVIHPQGSPLIIARDMLLERGLTPPVISDEYWLQVVEASNRIPGFGSVIPDESSWTRWSFYLPPREGGPAQWGERLAWTAMQMNWVKSADEIPITPLTPPQEVLDFIHSHTGLLETCETFPHLLVEYAPQLTIRGFEGDLKEVIEREYRKSCRQRQKDRTTNSLTGSACTTNNKSPLCDEEWALRHPTFGDYQPVYITNAYFSGGMFGPTVSPYEHADHAFWLLSDASSWLPKEIHTFLLAGMMDWHAWLWGYVSIEKGGDWKSNGALTRALYSAVDGRAFRLNNEIEDDLMHRIELSIKTLNLPDTVPAILERFLKRGFPAKFVKSERRMRRIREGKGSRKR